MKRIFTFLSFTLFVFTLNAQLADGSKVPANLSYTDLNDNVHNVQDYLDSGKVVIIDVFATWCPPCWFLHENEVLKNLYIKYGPEGTDEMVILSIEGDNTTATQELYGMGGNNTQGDWVTGTPYPVIEDNTAPTSFNLTFWPTIFMIRPSGQIILANDYLFANAQDTSFDYVYDLAFKDENDGGLSTTSESVLVCEPTDVSGASLSLQNFGSNPITSASISVIQNGEIVDEIMWEGNLLEFQTATITTPTLTEVSSTLMIDYVINQVNGNDDSYANDNVASYEVTRPIAEQEIELTITTDKWPEEISWEFKDETGNVIASSADLGTLACETTYTQSVDVSGTGCYEFSISDGYGDGILNQAVNSASHSCTNGDPGIAIGAVSLKADGIEYFNDINYGSGIDVPIAAVGSVGVKPIASLSDAKLYPNPAQDRVQLEFGLNAASDINIQVSNLLGQVVSNLGTQSFTDGENKIEVETSNFANGMYILTLSKGREISTYKFNVAR